MNKRVEKKPTLTERMDKLESKLSLVLDKFLAEPEEETPKKKEPDRDSEGNIIKYFKFVSPNPELLQMTEKRGRRHVEGDSYTIEPPETCSFGRDTEGPPGFFRTPDGEQAQRLRNVLKMLTEQKRPHVFTEVTDDPAFADY